MNEALVDGARVKHARDASLHGTVEWVEATGVGPLYWVRWDKMPFSGISSHLRGEITTLGPLDMLAECAE